MLLAYVYSFEHSTVDSKLMFQMDWRFGTRVDEIFRQVISNNNHYLLHITSQTDRYTMIFTSMKEKKVIFELCLCFTDSKWMCVSVCVHGWNSERSYEQRFHIPRCWCIVCAYPWACIWRCPWLDRDWEKKKNIERRVLVNVPCDEPTIDEKKKKKNNKPVLNGSGCIGRLLKNNLPVWFG